MNSDISELDSSKHVLLQAIDLYLVVYVQN